MPLSQFFPCWNTEDIKLAIASVTLLMQLVFILHHFLPDTPTPSSFSFVYCLVKIDCFISVALCTRGVYLLCKGHCE